MSNGNLRGFEFADMDKGPGVLVRVASGVAFAAIAIGGAWAAYTFLGDWPRFDGHGSGGFGLRWPLRFLTHQLGLDERQRTELAGVLDELKTERALAAMDERKASLAFADALSTDKLEAVNLEDASGLRVRNVERLRQANEKALRSVHGLLSGDQRQRFAALVRSGGV